MSQATVEEQMQNMPPQEQLKPGIQQQMTPKPLIDDPNYCAAGKLKNKVALITGGDSGIGASVAVLYAREGADVAIIYLTEEEADAQEVKKTVEKYGRKCLLIAGDITDKEFCRKTVDYVFKQYGKLDILVNNAAVQYESESILDMDMDKMEKTFQTNIFAMFYLCQAAVPYLSEDGSIINTSSVNSHKGHDTLMDYTSTKGAIDAFTISLAQQLADKKVRVNAVAPGPIWTPLIVDTFDEKHVAEFGKNVLMKRAGQPSEVSPCYVFLASQDASYMTGQILHPNGGTIVN